MSKMWGYILSGVVAILVIANVMLWMNVREVKDSGLKGQRAFTYVSDSLAPWLDRSTVEVRNKLCGLQFVVDSLRRPSMKREAGGPPCPGGGVPAQPPPHCCP